MAAIKISTGPRYQRTGSARQKKARQFSEMAEKIFADVLVSTYRRASKHHSAKPSQREKS